MSLDILAIAAHFLEKLDVEAEVRWVNPRSAAVLEADVGPSPAPTPGKSSSAMMYSLGLIA